MMEIPTPDLDAVETALREEFPATSSPPVQIQFGPITRPTPGSTHIAINIVEVDPGQQAYPPNSLPELQYTVEVLVAAETSVINEGRLYKEYLPVIVSAMLARGFRFKGSSYGTLVDRKNADHIMSIRFTKIL